MTNFPSTSTVGSLDINQNQFDESLIVHPSGPRSSKCSSNSHSIFSSSRSKSHKDRTYESKRCKKLAPTKTSPFFGSSTTYQTTTDSSNTMNVSNNSTNFNLFPNDDVSIAIKQSDVEFHRSLLRPSSLFFKSTLSTIPRLIFLIGDPSKNHQNNSSGRNTNKNSDSSQTPLSSNRLTNSSHCQSQSQSGSKMSITNPSQRLTQDASQNTYPSIREFDLLSICPSSFNDNIAIDSQDSISFDPANLEFSSDFDDTEWNSQRFIDIIDFVAHKTNGKLQKSTPAPHNTPSFVPAKTRDNSLIANHMYRTHDKNEGSAPPPSEALPNEWILV